MKAKNKVHYFEINDLLTLFADAFNNIIINRYDSDNVAKDNHRVRFLYAHKQRVIHNIVNKAEHITLPAIAISMGGISRDNDRVFRKNIGQYINRGKESDYFPSPVPINLTVNMSIIARYQTDMDQIISNFVPYTNPYIIISSKIPSQFTQNDIELRHTIFWNDDISLTYEGNDQDSKRRIIADTSFRIEGWLFKKHNENPSGNIYTIDTKFYPVSGFGILDDLDNFDQKIIEGKPKITFTNIDYSPLSSTNIYKLEGDMFNFTESIYLSANKPSIFNETLSSIDLFGNIDNLSADNPPFNGFLLSSSEYDIINDNIIYVNIPYSFDTGEYKIIVTNDAGYDSSLAIEIK